MFGWVQRRKTKNEIENKKTTRKKRKKRFGLRLGVFFSEYHHHHYLPNNMMRKGRRKFHIEKKINRILMELANDNGEKTWDTLVEQYFWERTKRTKSLLHLFIDSQVMEQYFYTAKHTENNKNRNKAKDYFGFVQCFKYSETHWMWIFNQ